MSCNNNNDDDAADDCDDKEGGLPHNREVAGARLELLISGWRSG